MIKVLHYIPGFQYGGIESMFLSWYENIDKNSFNFDLLLRTQDDDADLLGRYRNMGGKYHRLEKLSYRNINKFRKNVKEFFREHNDYDILHMHGTDIFIAYYAHRYGIKHIILHSHASEDSPGLKAHLKKLLDDIWNVYVTDIFACSEVAAKRLLKKKVFKHKQAVIIRNAIDCSQFAYNNSVRLLKRSDLVINSEILFGHIGRLTVQKNQFFLIDIFKKIIEISPSSKLLIAGDGPLEKNLKQYAKKNGLSNSVIFLGRRNDVPELLQAIDCFLLPSFYEGLPVTIIEAQAAGVPCIVSDSVTEEIEITDLIRKISLEKSAQTWAKETLNFLHEVDGRRCRTQEICASGFDIASSTNELEKQYISILTRKE